ncbi:RhaT Permease drug-metabolite transporter (DMT) superfamily [Pyrenophora tritici-repentis]|nr:RhaT Permease drug-metabolite transporter (DMT) superfamily [Pyrenophora tritici-repentis]KAI0612322.1 RhaT Permease drug-metabolite transporter (DMT) superfamily [Pyrenophora tritici-repentis]KAI0625351.1 RhaT Permease drug-metabolite transporter (DMT) superfamily [Pyrenophora tritici-repentis]
MVEDKYVGLMLAVSSSLAIGASFVITKKGLNASIEKHGFNGDGFGYLQNPVWWAGITTMVLGEIFNFAAYAFAPAILVTPLGALSVLIGAVLGSYFLDEQLGLLGKIGCAICLIGSVIIVLHAPPDKEVESVEEILNLALQPGFLFYCAFVVVFCIVMIYKIAPKYGRKNPLIYLSICSTSGSVSIMFIKAFGIALKMTFAGNNQFTHPSTYVFVILVVGCILTQMNYFNKALSQFSTNIVNPLYYVTFTTCTLVASCLLFQGFNTTSAVNTISLLCGFLIIFSGVYLLNLSREDPNGNKQLGSCFTDGPPSDAMSGFPTRHSMQIRRSEDLFERHSNAIVRDSRRSSYMDAGDRGALMHDYDVENQFELGDLADSDDDLESGQSTKRTSFDEETKINGRLSGTGRGRVQKESVQPKRNSTLR